MSGWGLGNVWGGSTPAKRKDTTKNAIVGLRSTLDMLTKRERHLENLMAEQDQIARKNVTTNKTAAKTALRRKKELEHDLEQTTAQQMTLQRQVSSIETANINKETLEALAAAGKAMKEIHGNTTIESVDNTLENLREQQAIADEVAEAITSGGQQSRVDEDELDEELAELQQEALDEQMLKTGPVPVSDQISRLPNQPNGPIKGKQTADEMDEEEELRKLQAEMAI